jgi:hypothetical protein
MALHPIPGFVLVELEGKYKNVSAKTKAYEGATNGVLRDVSGADYSEYIGHRVFWKDLVGGNPVTRDGKDYVFVRYEYIEGYEEVA